MNAARSTTLIRHSAERPCPVCGGFDGIERGIGERCFGFVSGDYVHCTREDLAGAENSYSPSSSTYAHKLAGPCPCGHEHRPADPKPASKTKGKIVATYDYHDWNGNLVFQVARMLPKSFRQRRPDPTKPGAWLWSVKGVYQYPFQAPRIAANLKETVYIVEGEKDALRLATFGLVATCNAGGAGKWGQSHSAGLKGRNVVILPDNDKAGEAHAEQVATSLRELSQKGTIKIVRLPDLPDKGDVSDWLDRGHSIADLKGIVQAAPEWVASEVITENAPTVAEPTDLRLEILITTEEKQVNDRAIVALGNDPEIYCLGQVLATVVRGKVGKRPKGIETPDGPAPQIARLSKATLRERMAHTARWRRTGADKKTGKPKSIPAHPPAWSVEAVEARRYWPGIRPIIGVVETPTMRPDGSILSQPGYDPATSLFYHPSDDFGEVPESPSRADARAAASRLFELIQDFPLMEGHDAVWLAALLTVVGRAAINGPTPLFAFDGNCPGTGKSLLADVIAVIATLRRMARTIWPSGRDADEEMRKRITALLSTGELTTLLDNVSLGKSLGGAPLDAVLTSMTWKDRILGKSETTPELPNRMVWFATGNNLMFGTDILRRVIPCRLVTQEERPEEREDFTIPDLLGHVKFNRSKYLIDALTILRAYHVAGRPKMVKPLGSYEAWSALIAGAVAWATNCDPLATRASLAAEDPGSQHRQTLFEGLAKLERMRLGMTASEIREAVLAKPVEYSILREALMEFSRNDELPNPRMIGNHFRGLKDRVVGHHMLIAYEDSHNKVAKWQLKAVAGYAGSSGVDCQSLGCEENGAVNGASHGKNSRQTTPQDHAHPAKNGRTADDYVPF